MKQWLTVSPEKDKGMFDVHYNTLSLSDNLIEVGEDIARLILRAKEAGKMESQLRIQHALGLDK